MFFRHPFFRHAACDLEQVMTRKMLRNEMVMRNELLRAMNAFEALEQEAFHQGNHRHHRDHHQQHQRHQRNIRAEEKEALEQEALYQGNPRHYRDHHNHQYRPQRNIRAEEKEAQNTKPRETKEAQNTANKARESEVNHMKAREAESKKAQESKELRQQHQRRGDVFSEWNNSLDNFFREVSPFGHRYSIFDDFYHPRYDTVGRYAEEMRADMDKHFKDMENPEAKQEYPKLAENSSYFMRVETNDNGHVRVKTVQKAPGTPWETKFEEYKREKSAVEKENKQSIETKENLEASQKKIAEEPQKTSESASSASA